MAETQEGPSKEATGLASQFVSALGLMDLILGGVALYWVSLEWSKTYASAFPSTKIQFVDVALLVAFAANLGKVLLLIVYSIAAFVDRVIYRKLGVLSYFEALTATVDKYITQIGAPPRVGEDPVRLAAAYVSRERPDQQQKLEVIENNSYFAYGIGLLLIGYLHYLTHYPRTHISEFSWLLPIIFFFWGFCIRETISTLYVIY